MDFNLPLKFSTEQIAPNFWRFNEGMGDNPYVDAYLVVGDKRAAFIDALQSEQPRSLVDQIREITDLPVDVLITHGHPDHAGAEVKKFAEADGFNLYMSMDDFPIARNMFAPWFEEGMFKDIKEGDVFDLGGIKLEAIRVAGHTPGSFSFLDRENGRCFTGDALGVWMQLDHSLTLTEYVSELRKFEKVLAGVPGVRLYIGHMTQAPNGYHTAEHVTNMIEACEKILSGELEGQEVKLPPEMADSPMAALMKGARILQYKTANVTYRDSKLR